MKFGAKVMPLFAGVGGAGALVPTRGSFVDVTGETGADEAEPVFPLRPVRLLLRLR